MHEFEQGDIAICVNASEDADGRFYGNWTDALTVGKRYDVLGVIGDYLQIIDDTDKRQGWNKYRFHKLQIPQTKYDTAETTLTFHNFKSGDRLMCIDPFNTTLYGGCMYTYKEDGKASGTIRLEEDTAGEYKTSRFKPWSGSGPLVPVPQPEDTYTREDLQFVLEMNDIGGHLDSMCAMIAAKKAFEKLKNNEEFKTFVFELSNVGIKANNLVKTLTKDLK